MIRISHSEKCVCKRRPIRSGRYYFGREACRACGGFIVRSPIELAVLREAELQELERERELCAPKGNGQAA